MKEENVTYYKAASAPIWTWKAVILAAIATLAIFLILPFSELVSRQSRSALSLRHVDITSFRPPPPPKPLSPRRPRQEKSKMLKPKLTKLQRKLMPLQIGSILELGEISGDFALDFAFQPLADLGVEDLVFELSEVDQPPQPVVQLPPLYPLSARAKGVEGKVNLVFVVQIDGSVRDLKAVSSSPGIIFVKAALNAVKQWKFKPAIKDGRAVAARVRLPLRFQLEN